MPAETTGSNDKVQKQVAFYVDRVEIKWCAIWYFHGTKLIRLNEGTPLEESGQIIFLRYKTVKSWQSTAQTRKYTTNKHTQS